MCTAGSGEWRVARWVFTLNSSARGIWPAGSASIPASARRQSGPGRTAAIGDGRWSVSARACWRMTVRMRATACLQRPPSGQSQTSETISPRGPSRQLTSTRYGSARLPCTSPTAQPGSMSTTVTRRSAA